MAINNIVIYYNVEKRGCIQKNGEYGKNIQLYNGNR